ncbi:EF-hand domain-containing protein [Rhizobium paknamense]|uniref:Ca2+-binding EF-hand superfamily protein n=1 Tax=Rhizobium paknamense TaxID=1206817 RepID=A0ABU0IA84_9HYPH|nr:EF-hand domain-containing protein [Rhizobium paknamense]MDQ0454191.1 Ca2+-binding EF-hand superfamily protein [Rhizobium paknamense]
MTSVSSAATSILSSYTTSTSSLDTDGDGTVSSAELAAAGITRTQDPTVLTDSAATSATSQLSGDMALLLAGDDSSSTSSISSMPTPPSAEERFDSMDSDGDGKVTEEEFTAAAPEGVSEEQSAALFEKLDSEGTGYITEDQLAADQQQGGPQGGPPMPPSDMSLASSLTDDTDSDSDLLGMDDIFSQMRSVIEAYQANEASTATTTTTEQAA